MPSDVGRYNPGDSVNPGMRDPSDTRGGIGPGVVPNGSAAGGSGAVGLFSAEAGGPLMVGHRGDKHNIGMTKDGEPINAGHIETSAFFYNDVEYDAPLNFELHDYPKPAHFPLDAKVHLVYDRKASHTHLGKDKTGMWKWYAEVPEMKVPPPPPPTTGRPTPTTPTPRSPPTTPTPSTPPATPITPTTPSTPGATTPGTTPTGPTTGGSSGGSTGGGGTTTPGGGGPPTGVLRPGRLPVTGQPSSGGAVGDEPGSGGGQDPAPPGSGGGGEPLYPGLEPDGRGGYTDEYGNPVQPWDPRHPDFDPGRFRDDDAPATPSGGNGSGAGGGGPPAGGGVAGDGQQGGASPAAASPPPIPFVDPSTFDTPEKMALINAAAIYGPQVTIPDGAGGHRNWIIDPQTGRVRHWNGSSYGPRAGRGVASAGDTTNYYGQDA